MCVIVLLVKQTEGYHCISCIWPLWTFYSKPASEEHPTHSYTHMHRHICTSLNPFNSRYIIQLLLLRFIIYLKGAQVLACIFSCCQTHTSVTYKLFFRYDHLLVAFPCEDLPLKEATERREERDTPKKLCKHLLTHAQCRVDPIYRSNAWQKTKSLSRTDTVFVLHMH